MEQSKPPWKWSIIGQFEKVWWQLIFSRWFGLQTLLIPFTEWFGVTTIENTKKKTRIPKYALFLNEAKNEGEVSQSALTPLYLHHHHYPCNGNIWTKSSMKSRKDVYMNYLTSWPIPWLSFCITAFITIEPCFRRSAPRCLILSLEER